MMIYTYEQAKQINGGAHLNPEEFCAVLGTLFDTGFDRKETASIEKALKLSENRDMTEFDDFWKAVCYYYTANGWGYLQQLKKPTGPHLDFSLESEERQNEIDYLRKALVLAEQFDNSHLIAQILTNLGNAMNHVGRFIEAIYYWNCAIKVLPDFGMAVGNLGSGLVHASKMIYDESQQLVFSSYAYRYLSQAANNDHVYREARLSFIQNAQLLADRYGHDLLIASINFNDSSIPASKLEKAYRSWSSLNALFLNPLNDFINEGQVLNDSFFLPGIITNTVEPPLYFTIFNQLKQEYVSARFFLYEGVQATDIHFSDKHNFQVDTFDHAVFSMDNEKIKIAFRLCYSIFDKIAYLLNDYLQVGLSGHEVTFRKIWYQKQKGVLQLKPLLMNSQNLALRGLFWVSKDLMGKGEETISRFLPGTTQLVDIRNFIEHKSFTIVETGETKETHNGMTMQVTRSELINRTIDLMKMVRAALMYTSFAIFIEEQTKVSTNTVPMMLLEVDKKNHRKE